MSGVSLAMISFYKMTSSFIGIQISGFKDLCARVSSSAGAFHNSGEVSDQPKCHPGTRIAILDHLLAWAAALTYAYPIIWLHGPAGAGKSAILRTIAQILFDCNLLLAGFFFSRSAAGRNSVTHFIATIAYQLTLSIPATRAHIDMVIEKNPLIFSLSLWDQALNLIVSPILAVHAKDPFCVSNPMPRIIVVDGLDECRGPDKQCELLQVLFRALQCLPIPFAVLVASRPEHNIRDAFNFSDLSRFSSRLALDNFYNPDADIKKYLLENFNTIKENPCLNSYIPISSPWPSEEVLDNLVAKASGQFIFGSTIVKFISSPRHNPAKRLDIVLGTLDAGNLKPFEQLDMLYSTIFLTVDPADLPHTLRILGVLLVPYNDHAFDSRRTPGFLEQLLELDDGDVRNFLFDLESLLTVGRKDENISFFHASLSDYLFDKSRSGQFWIDVGLIYADLAQHCIHRLSDSIRHVKRNGVVKTASSFMDIVSSFLMDDISTFFKDQFSSFFMANILSFFSKASPTVGLRQAVNDFDFAEVGLHYLGVRNICPALLEAAIHHSKFTNPQELFSVQLLAYRQIIEPRIHLYFQNVHLKYLLITTVATGKAINGEIINVFGFPSELRKTDSVYGLCILHHNLDNSPGIPPIILYLRRLFNDPTGGFFIDKNQYADATLYLLESVRQNPGSLAKVVQCGILGPLFSRSAVRTDLLQSATLTLAQLTSTHLSFFPSLRSFRGVLNTYISSSKSDRHGGVGGNSKLPFGKVESPLQGLPTQRAPRTTDRPNSSANGTQFIKTPIPAASSRLLGRDTTSSKDQRRGIGYHPTTGVGSKNANTDAPKLVAPKAVYKP
ncbi:hypothetical protein GALMADRAFT_136473 [Galerina marginata CBS 339.88]|uniref:Nephrocystin 3-like N-terminal domain-containing protein n=1 Tax=Galerina marginata (strain CBS 339.88) TaxID=685588 RepID=A0A067T9L7_GALM3|nr:hypothetical protein GALMADRAFT_136473 [Galerina marginata CBS 339.88]